MHFLNLAYVKAHLTIQLNAFYSKYFILLFMNFPSMDFDFLWFISLVRWIWLPSPISHSQLEFAIELWMDGNPYSGEFWGLGLHAIASFSMTRHAAWKCCCPIHGIFPCHTAFFSICFPYVYGLENGSMPHFSCSYSFSCFAI